MSEKSNLLRAVTITGVICSTVSFGTFLSSSAKAATIGSITLDTETSVASSTTVNGITYQGYSRSITAFTSGGNNWDVNPVMDMTFTVRRSGNAPTATDTNKQVVWERCSTTANCNSNIVRGTQPTTTQAALAQNNIYVGTDNFFTNTANGVGNQSDVERADFVFSSGYLATSNVGVTVFERGTATGHDSFAIAAITGFDAGNNPIYSSLKRYTLGWGTTDLLSSSDYRDYRVLNNGSNGTDQFSVTSNGTQTIGGELILLTDLVSANTAVFGYSLFAQDTFNAVTGNSCTIAQLSNVANTNCYANTTAEANGGIDLLSVNIGISSQAGTSPTKIPEPLSMVGTIMGGAAVIGVRKKLKAVAK